MSVQMDRHGHVAIIVTAREYQALLSASTMMAEELTNDLLDGGHMRRDLRSIDSMLDKARSAGIRTSVPE